MAPVGARGRGGHIGRRGLLTGAVALAACRDTVEPGKEEQDALGELSPDGARPDVLRIGITPSTGADTSERLQPLVDYLAERLNVRAVGQTAESYDRLASMIDERNVEIGVFSPLAYVRAMSHGSEAVAIATATRMGSPTYLGYLVIAGHSPPPLEALRGRSVAWVNRSSTSGYLYPRAMLAEKGHDPGAFFGEERIAGDHGAVIEAVASGRVEVGAVAGSFVDPDSGSTHARADELAVVAKTRRIPLDCVVVHERLDRELARDLRDALLGLVGDEETSRELGSSWGLDGFVEPLHERYREIARVNERMG